MNTYKITLSKFSNAKLITFPRKIVYHVNAPCPDRATMVVHSMIDAYNIKHNYSLTIRKVKFMLCEGGKYNA